MIPNDSFVRDLCISARAMRAPLVRPPSKQYELQHVEGPIYYWAVFISEVLTSPARTRMANLQLEVSDDQRRKQPKAPGL